jgi:hypothetical protein
MERNEYEKCVYMACDLLVSLMPNKTIITKQKVCEIWNKSTDRRPDVPGYYLTDAMENWGKQNGYQLMFNVNKHGKRKNVMLVKA